MRKWRGLSVNIRDRACLYLSVAPLIAYILVFTFVPVLCGVWLGFAGKFSGAFPSWENYRYIVSHFQFRSALLNTLIITGVGLFLELVAGFFLAFLLTKKFKLKGFVRALVLLPLGIPTIVSAATMRSVFDTQGYLNEFLYRAQLIRVAVDWGDGGMKTLFAVVVSDMWKVTPLVMLILLAGLESIPGELYEAARVDGASALGTLRHITIPLLKPFIVMALVVRGIDAFRLFELPLALAGRGSPVLSTYAYFEYMDYNNPNTAAAAASILFAIILLCVVLVVKTTTRKVLGGK
ncbi:MAG: sugar ABC transporter permease [Lentisphaerae bacterium]|nr:sugar ABC transporter permease [Lentisphaerota bacterium]